MNLPTITPDQARARLESGDGYVYLDVRTVEEFEAGRPPGAFNIPIMVRDPATGQPQVNDDFLKIVEARFPRDHHIIVGCHTMSRSAHATALLLEAGYQNVATMAGGFGGVGNPSSENHQPGWANMNYPIETGPTGEKGYDSLRQQRDTDRRS